MGKNRQGPRCREFQPRAGGPGVDLASVDLGIMLRSRDVP